MLGIIVIAKKPKYARVSSLVTLFFLCTYLVVRGWSRGILHI
jgi:hypothetical protein